MFTDVFDIEFRKIVARFLLYYPTINIGSLKYTLDDSRDNPVVFSNEFVQKLFDILNCGVKNLYYKLNSKY